MKQVYLLLLLLLFLPPRLLVLGGTFVSPYGENVGLNPRCCSVANKESKKRKSVCCFSIAVLFLSCIEFLELSVAIDTKHLICILLP